MPTNDFELTVRFLICTIKIENVSYTIVNIYAPNRDEPSFFEKIVQKIMHNPCENLIVGGDFNLTLNPEIDRYNSTSNNNKSMEYLKEFMKEAELSDAWRTFNPDKKRYSWYKKQPTMSVSHIEFILVNVGLL